MADNVLSVELVIEDGAFDAILKRNETKLQNLGQNARPKVNFSAVEKSFTDLEKQANQTRKSFEDVVKVRLDAGNVNAFTKEVFRAQEQSKQLLGVIQNTRTALSQTTDKSLIKIYLQDLKAAEVELGQLQRKQQSLLSGQPNAVNQTGGKQSGRGGGRISYNQATFLEFADDFAPQGLNRPFNAAGRALFAAQNIKEAAGEMGLLGAVSGTTLLTFGAIAAAGYGIVKVTQNIRAEAERRLKVEEAIQGAINRQIISQREAIANFKELLKVEQQGRDFNRFLQSGDIDDLKRRRANLEEIQKFIPAELPTLENGKLVSKPNDRFEQSKKEISALAAQIDALQQKRTKDANDNFRQQSANDQKSLAQSAEFAIAAQKKRSEEIEKSKAKAKELEKVYLSVYDSLAAKSGQNNPFVSLFTEADKSLRVLRENTKGLSKDLISTFEQMQAKQNEISLFSARLDNRLNVFDLRDSAENFRNPVKQFDAAAEKARTESIGQQAFESGIAGRIRAANGEFGKLTDAQKQQIYQQAGLDYIGQLNSPGSTFNGLNQNSLISSFASENKKNPNLSLQERLQKQFDIVDNVRGSAKTDDERSIADRRIIALTQGLNPNQLTDSEREKAAIARENEAVRLSNQEKTAKVEREKDRAIQQQIADNTKRFLDLAEKEGLKAILEIVDKTGGGINFEPSPTNKDTQDYYSR